MQSPFSARFAVLLILVCCFSPAIAQLQEQTSKPLPFDTNYYQTYPKQITVRSYLSKKYTQFDLGGGNGAPNLKYRPNNATSIGVGATYGIVTLNLGVGMPFTKAPNDEKGKTKTWDLQAHIFARKFMGDFYGQFYKGYFLQDGVAAGSGKHYYRDDIRVNVLGAALYRITNSRKFSFRSTYLQNEWQKKSAGTWLIGGEVHFGTLKGDSALVPSVYAGTHPRSSIDNVQFIQFGPGVGYAYTAVINKHFFVMASATVNGDFTFVEERSPTREANEFSFNPNFIARAGIGYNSDTWGANFNWVANRLSLKGSSYDKEYMISTGNVRFTVARRISPRGKLRKKLDKIETALPIISMVGK